MYICMYSIFYWLLVSQSGSVPSTDFSNDKCRSFCKDRSFRSLFNMDSSEILRTPRRDLAQIRHSVPVFPPKSLWRHARAGARSQSSITHSDRTRTRCPVGAARGSALPCCACSDSRCPNTKVHNSLSPRDRRKGKALTVRCPVGARRRSIVSAAARAFPERVPRILWRRNRWAVRI